MISRTSIVRTYPIKPLSEVVDFLDYLRRPIKESERESGPYPYFGANGQQGTIGDYLFNEPLVLLAEDGGHFDDPQRGVAYRVSGKTWVNNHAHVLRPKSGIDLAYLCRVLENYDLTPFVTGTTRGKLTQAGASEIPVPIPPHAEQRRIAAILDQADELRRKRREFLHRATSLIPSVFSEMFGNLDNNWPLCRLEDIVRCGTIITYGIVQAGDEFPNGVPYIRTGDIVDGEIRRSGLRRTDPSIAARFARSRVEAGDIVMSIRATVGTTALVPDALDGANLTQGTARIAPGEKSDTQFLLNFLRSEEAQRWIKRQVKGATFREITLARLRDLPVRLPPLALQRAFAARAADAEKLRADSGTCLASLDALFASLQHRAFRGELVVKSAERKVAAVG